MKIKETVTEEHSVILCDICGSKNIPFVNRINPCCICGKDVCVKCSIVTDHWMLEDGEYLGDYPEHYCRECWEKGKPIVEQILHCRHEERNLWGQWQKECRLGDDK